MKTPLLLAVFLAFFGILAGARGSYGEPEHGIVLGVLGGPVAPSVIKLPVISPRDSADSIFPPDSDVSASSFGNGGSNTVLGLAQSHAAIFPEGVEMTPVTYSVKKKDTILAIAKTFGVSPKDILDANPALKGSKTKLKAGQVLALAVPVKSSSDSSSALAAALQGGASPSYSGAITTAQSKAYFKMPAEGFNWGKLHNYNAVDIANVCGTPIVAPAEGIVVNDENFGDGSGDWNGGYGRFVLLEHPNGTKTRMAHLEKISVSIGDLVKKGQQLGTMGQTGDATGCHVHFEVLGAPNPFAKSQ